MSTEITQKIKGKAVQRYLDYLRQNSKLVVIGIIGILLVLASSLFDGSVKNRQAALPDDTVKAPPASSTRSVEEALEAKLANLLSQVQGAGAVVVNVTLENSAAADFAKNVTRESKTIQENDNSGGIRTTTENKESEQILLGKENGTDKPVMISETKPVIKGVLVIAEGAADSTVKNNLTQAVETGLGIAAYKVTVLPQRK
jgi:stage III sporulation protein AG